MYYKSLDHVLAALTVAKTNPKKAIAHFKAAVHSADLNKAVAALERHQQAEFASVQRKAEAAAKKKAVVKAKPKKKGKTVKAEFEDFDSVIDNMSIVEESETELDLEDDLSLDDISEDIVALDDSLDDGSDLSLEEVEFDEGLSDGIDDLPLDDDLGEDDLDGGEFAAEEDDEDDEGSDSDESEEDDDDDSSDDDEFGPEPAEASVGGRSGARNSGSRPAVNSAVNRMARANSNLRALSALSRLAPAPASKTRSSARTASAKKPATSTQTVARRTPGV
jgi:hypothetical protein